MHIFKSLTAAATASLALVSAPALAEVVATQDDAFVTRDTAVVSADLRETWLALITPGKWWNSAHTFSGDSANLILTPQGGGCFCERIPAKDDEGTIGLAGSVEHMSVLLAIPDQALRMEGALGPLQSEPVSAILTVTLAEAEKGTQIVFEYSVGGFMRYEVPVISKAVDGVMSQQLAGLAKLLGPVDAPPSAKVEDTEAVDDEDASDTAEAEDDAEENSAPKPSVDEAFGDLAADDQ